MAHVEGDWGETGWAGVKLRVGEQATVMMEINLGEFESVKNGTRNGGKIREGAAKPRFGKRRCW